MAVIPTFIFCMIPYSEIIRLVKLPGIPKGAILSFNHRLSFKSYRSEKTPDLHDVKSGVDAVNEIPAGVLLPDRSQK